MSSIERIGEQVIFGNKNRRHFEREPLQLAEQIRDEAIELIEEITESLITGCPNTVVGEIGDLYVLLAQLCEDLGVNPVQAMEMKLLRNSWKYQDHINNNGYSREEAVRMSKESWKAFGGDERFSHIYLDIISGDE